MHTWQDCHCLRNLQASHSEEGGNLIRQVGHFDALVVAVFIVGMKADNLHFGYFYAVFCLKDSFVDIELQTIVPVVGVRKMFDARGGGEVQGGGGRRASHP